MPCGQRSSGKAVSSPTTSPTVRVRCATAVASVDRQSTRQSGAEDSRASPCPARITVGRSVPSSRTVAPPRVSGAATSSVAKAAAVVNSLVFEAGMNRSSGRIATISRPSASTTSKPMRVPGGAFASASATAGGGGVGAGGGDAGAACAASIRGSSRAGTIIGVRFPRSTGSGTRRPAPMAGGRAGGSHGHRTSPTGAADASTGPG